MPFPKDADALKAAGWVFDNDATCRGCGDDIEWWITEAGNKMPMNPMPRGTSEATSHFASCTEADSFRRSK